MYEYKVGTYKVKEAQEAMNKLAGEGWRVVTACANTASGMVVTYERKKDLQYIK